MEPKKLLFGYHFTYHAKMEDLEALHILSSSSGKLKGSNFPKVLEGAINPMKREMLFEPELVLYLNKPEWEEAFRCPRYAISLGRSQDLFMLKKVEQIALQKVEDVYFEHTLLPKEMLLGSAGGYVLLLPRFLDYTKRRRPQFSHYLILHARTSTRQDQFGQYLRMSKHRTFWADPTAPILQELPMGVYLHNFVDDDED